MLRLLSLHIIVLCFCIFPVSAQTAVTDAALVTQTNAAITNANAAAITQLSVWTVQGAVSLDWVGDQLAVAATRETLIYNTANLALEPVRIEGAARDVAFSPDGELLAIADDQSVRVWDTDANAVIATLSGASPLAFSNTMLAYGDGTNAMILWDTTTRNTRALIVGHSDRITAVDFSPDGQTLVTTSLDTTLRLWNVNTGEQTGFSRSRRRPALSVEFSPSGALLASGAQRGLVRLNNLAVDTERVLSRSLQADVTNIHFSPTGSIMLFSAGTTIQIWDTGAQSATVVLSDSQGAVLDVIFNPAGTLIASVDEASTIRLWGVPAA